MAEATEGQNSDWFPLLCADSPWHRGPLITRLEELPLAPPPISEESQPKHQGVNEDFPPGEGPFQGKEGGLGQEPPQLAVFKKGVACGFKEQLERGCCGHTSL